ncbi:MAG: hypothetical protein KC506_00660 [Nanoarchaeota archaeon]|nr:hypothetical protein [Nanoarchaeota archaeon]
MIFGKKNKINCESCGSNVEKKFNFCPHCGSNFMSSKKEKIDYGFLGKNDLSENDDFLNQPQLGMFDKLLNSMVNNMLKSIDKQMKDQLNPNKNFEKANIKSLPNGIKIKISGPFDSPQKISTKPKRKVIREINEEQLERISKLPRTKAKSNVKRLGDKLVYELSTPGVSSPQDVFISKLESGYEVKAIGSKNVYVNSVPINLPLSKYSILKNKLHVEFLTEQQE